MKKTGIRKVIAAIGAAALALVLASCSSGGSSGDSTSSASGSGEAKMKVAMVIDSSISDGGWGTSCYKAMIDAADEHGWETAYSESVSTADFVTTIEGYAGEGYDLVYCPGAEFQDAVEQASKDYPDTHFCILNGSLESDNVVSMLPDAEQIGSLAGAAAGLITQTGNVGFIGGTELDTTKAKLEAFTAAAKKVNPSVNVTSAYAGSFDDTAKGKEIALSMMSTNDVDVLFGDASAVDTGAREALASKEGTFDIGQPDDMGGASDALIAVSIVTDNSSLVSECMTDVESGSFGNKTIEGNLENGGVKVGTWSNIVSSDVQAKYVDIVDQIEKGTF